MQNRIKEERKKQQKAQAVDKQKAALHPTLSTFIPPMTDASSASASHSTDLSEQTPAQKKNLKKQAHNEGGRKARAEGRWTINTLFDIGTGKPAPKGASKSEQYITFNAYLKRHVKHSPADRRTYVNAKTGKPAPGITQETHQRGQHTTLYSWQVRQKYTEFSKILKDGGNLPPLLPGTISVQQNAAAQAAAKRKADLLLPPPPSKRNKQQKAQAIDERKADLLPTLSTFVPPASHPLPTPPDTPLSSYPANASDAPASRIMNPSELTPAQKKNLKRQIHNANGRKARAEGRWKSSKLFDIGTGKPAPKGASISEQYITFTAYVRRHVKDSIATRGIYVNRKTGKPTHGITNRTHQRGRHITLYSWLVHQKYTEFSKILANGGDLPPVSSRNRNMQQNAPVADKQKADVYPAHSTFVQPIAEASSASGDPHSSLTTAGHAAVMMELSTSNPLPPSPPLNEIPSATSSISEPILPPASHLLPTPPNMPLNSNSEEALDASVHPILSLISSSSEQASPLSSLDLETFVEDILLTESPFAAESDTPVSTSLMESDLTAQTATAIEEPLPLLSENATEENVEMDYNFYSSAPVTSQPAFSPSPATPLSPDSAEAFEAITRPCLDPVISAAHSSFEQDPSRKRKPNVHSFFQPDDKDRAGNASRKAKTIPSDGSAEHPLPEIDTLDSTSAESFTLSPPAKTPSF